VRFSFCSPLFPSRPILCCRLPKLFWPLVGARASVKPKASQAAGRRKRGDFATADAAPAGRAGDAEDEEDDGDGEEEQREAEDEGDDAASEQAGAAPGQAASAGGGAGVGASGAQAAAPALVPTDVSQVGQDHWPGGKVNRRLGCQIVDLYAMNLMNILQDARVTREPFSAAQVHAAAMQQDPALHGGGSFDLHMAGSGAGAGSAWAGVASSAGSSSSSGAAAGAGSGSGGSQGLPSGAATLVLGGRSVFPISHSQLAAFTALIPAAPEWNPKTGWFTPLVLERLRSFAQLALCCLLERDSPAAHTPSGLADLHMREGALNTLANKLAIGGFAVARLPRKQRWMASAGYEDGEDDEDDSASLAGSIRPRSVLSAGAGDSGGSSVFGGGDDDDDGASVVSSATAGSSALKRGRGRPRGTSRGRGRGAGGGGSGAGGVASGSGTKRKRVDAYGEEEEGASGSDDGDGGHSVTASITGSVAGRGRGRGRGRGSRGSAGAATSSRDAPTGGGQLESSASTAPQPAAAADTAWTGSLEALLDAPP